MTSAMNDDERLARQLQAEEAAQSNNAPNPVYAQAQVVSPAGNVQHGGVVMGTVVQGTAVGGTPVPATAVPVAQGITVAGAPVGLPQPVAYGMAGDVVYAADVGSQIPAAEILVLNYRFSLTCFACIDVALSVLMVFSLGGAGALLAIFFIGGPVCGIIGARQLRRAFILVYLIFSVLKTVIQILQAVAYLGSEDGSTWRAFWVIMMAVVQVWITSTIFKFWKALGIIGVERCKELLDPNFAASLQQPPRFVMY